MDNALWQECFIFEAKISINFITAGMPKPKYLLPLILIFLLAAAPFCLAQKKFVIVLDAGHGGKDDGATNTYPELGTVKEKDITLAVVLKVGAALERDGNYRVIYTRKVDEYPSLTERTQLANRSKANLFVSVHVNSSTNRTPYGTETFVQGPDQNRTNLEVAKAENAVIFLDDKDKEVFGQYDAHSPESLIALKLQQQKYLESSLLLGQLVEDNFTGKDRRFSRGVKQQNLHVLRMNAMPSVLIETGFVSNPEDAAYLASERGQNEVAASIVRAIQSYKKAIDRKMGVQQQPKTPAKPVEVPLKNDMRILLFASPVKANPGDPALRGFKPLTIKEGVIYKYYFGNTNYASVRDANLKTAKDAGFRNATAVSFVPNQKMANGFYTIEVYAGEDRLKNDSPILKMLQNVEREKVNGIFSYTYGRAETLEEALKLQQKVEGMGIRNTALVRR